jgi:hypothetical protein
MISRGAETSNELIDEIGQTLTDLEQSVSSSTLKVIALEILTSPEIMVELFRKHVLVLYPEHWVIKRCCPRIIKRRLGSRQVIAYRLYMSAGDSPKTKILDVIGKRYADRAEGERAFRTLELFWKNGFGQGSELRVPRPLGYLREFNLLLQEKARGTPLSLELARGTPASITGLKVAADWLARLHAMNGASGGIISLAEDETRAKQFANSLGELYPSLAGELEELSADIMHRTSSFKDVQLAPIHGDFHPENIFVRGASVTVIDFDNCAKADPARDLGYIVAQMLAKEYLTPSSMKKLHCGSGAFLNAYLSRISLEEQQALMSRIAAYAALAVLEIMYYVLCVCRDDRPELLPSFVEEIRRLIGAKDYKDLMRV